jgi:hypothetical protein
MTTIDWWRIGRGNDEGQLTFGAMPFGYCALRAAPTLNTGGQFQAPGYDKPIPLNSGGGAGASGAGQQNLGSFANPPSVVYRLK